MKIKCGRNEFDLTTDDIIMFNGSVYILLTRKVSDGWHHSSPSVAKTRATKLIKEGLLKPVELNKPPYKGKNIIYYRIIAG